MSTVMRYQRLSHFDHIFVCLWRSGNKTELFSDLSAFPVLQERREQIRAVVSDIHDHRREIRLTLKAPAFDYTAVSGQEVPSLCVCVLVRDRWEEIDGPIWVDDSVTAMI